MLSWEHLMCSNLQVNVITCESWGLYGFYLTIIPRARIGYEMIDSERGV